VNGRPVHNDLESQLPFVASRASRRRAGFKFRNRLSKFIIVFSSSRDHGSRHPPLTVGRRFRELVGPFSLE
jgi:hypothetical protein